MQAKRRKIVGSPALPRFNKSISIRGCCEIAFCSRYTRAEPTGLEFAAKFSRCCTWVHFSSVKCTLMQERKKVVLA